MKDAEKIKTIQRNMDDGLGQAWKPTDDRSLLCDIETKLSMFDLALEGLKDKASHSEIDHRDMISLTYSWINLHENLTRALALLEYVDRALDRGEVDLNEAENHFFSIGPLRTAIKAYREEFADVHKKLEEAGIR